MAASASYNGYSFPLMPQIGESLGYRRSFDGGPAQIYKRVTLTFHYKNFTTYAANRAEMESLFAACRTNIAPLVVNDGSVERINANAWVDDVGYPPQWGQKVLEWTVVFGYFDSNTGSKYGLTCTYTSDAEGTLDLSANPPTYSDTQGSERRALMSSVHRQTIAVTLRGFYKGATRQANQAFIQTLQAQEKTTNGTLVYGGLTMTAYPQQFTVEEHFPETGLGLPYALTFNVYTESFDPEQATFVYGDPATTLTLTVNKGFSQSMTVNRDSPSADAKGATLTRRISGEYYGTNRADREAFLTSLVTACSYSGCGTLTYGGISSSVAYLSDHDIPETTTGQVIPWSLTFSISIAPDDAPAGIVSFSTKTEWQLPAERNVFHVVPFVDGSTLEYLGLSDYWITYSGTYVGTTLADAQTAAEAQKTSWLAGGKTEAGSPPQWSEDADKKEVTYSVRFRYYTSAQIAAARDLRTPG